MLRSFLARAAASPVLWAGAFGMTYFVGAELGHALTFNNDVQVFAAFWPPAGLFLAALTLTDYRAWGRLLAAAGLANLASDALLHGKPLPVSLGFLVANGLEVALGAWLLRRSFGPSVTLGRLKEVAGLGLLGALASPVVGATVGALTVTLAYGGPFWGAWRMWWLADATGVLVVAPVVFAWVGERPTLPLGRPVRLVEAALLIGGLLVAAVGVYGGAFPGLLRVPIVILPFLLWAGLRFGPRGSSVALLVVAVIGLWFISRGQGPFAALTPVPGEQALRAQLSLGVISLCVLCLAATVSERNRAEQERLALIGELQGALAEIKTLRGLLPICAWCKRVRDDKDFWHTVEDYVTAHTDARFSHGMCPDCFTRVVGHLKQGEP